MIRIFSTNKRKISTVTLFAFLLQLFYPVSTYALTGGPSQPEYESFEPAGATEMVNLATGDFIYNIPLMDIDGYPINIAYHGGVNMEQEASWVGLGWSLNPGSINRGMRGLPDDFSGGADITTNEIHIKPNDTYGVSAAGGVEVSGFNFASLGLDAGFGIKYNTYKGIGLDLSFGISGGLGVSYLGLSGGASGGLGLVVSNQDGADFTMSGGLNVGLQASYGGIGVGAGLGLGRSKTNNSRRGIEADIVSGSFSGSGSIQGVGFGTGTGSSINLIPNTAYTPSMQFPTEFSGITGEVHVGGELFWVSLHGSTKAYIFHEGIAGSTFNNAAYGYLNLENANAGSILDFNRDNDGVYYLECPKLPFSNLTYDLFNTNAQGLNEVFRPYRNDVGFVYDNFSSGGGTANDVGAEASFGNVVQLGANENTITSNSSSGAWFSLNNAFNKGLKFQGDNQFENDGTKIYEHSYFKALDELPNEDLSFYNSILGANVASFKLNSLPGTNIAILENNITNGLVSSTFTSALKKQNREARSSNFSFLNELEAGAFGLDKKITSYAVNDFSFNSATGDFTNYSQNLRNSIGSENHISEVTVLKEDGSRYIYGVPIYNKTQKEVVFNVASRPTNTKGNIEYSSGDDSPSNNLGIDNYFSSKNISPYAHSYLLTALLSKDYVDISGNGLSDDDFGDYTKFNYSKTSDNYKWRNPCTAPSAITPEALYEPQWHADQSDDKGIYIYGEKELWYPHSIETKNYVAEFHTSLREDARGVVDKDGRADASGINNQSYKLDKIVLYSKKDRTTPIKTVNFKYVYTLCEQTPNSIASSNNPNKGKLTLDKIYFTYGKSDKGVFSPYEFKYCDFNHDGNMDAGLNPNYNRTEMDRWGVYKPNSSVIDNRDFPYSEQNKTNADNHSAVWSLSSVVTPAKSKIDVYYESDDYSYIQNQVPGQMLKIVDFLKAKPNIATSISFPSYSDLYDHFSPFSPNNYMIIDLSDLKDGGLLATSPADAETTLRNKMLPANGKLFFKGFVQLGDNATTNEFVPGYSEFDANNSGILSQGSITVGANVLYKYAYIKLNEMDIEDPKNSVGGDICNPISKAAWQITRLYQPKIAYPGSEPGGSGLLACVGLLSALTEVFTLKEKNIRLRKKYFGIKLIPSKSFIRLNVPTKSKFGGGHRISKIEITDNWNSMVSGEATTTYGQTYNYTVDDNGNNISSGVASYEPLTGGDEISLRRPYEYSVERVAAPNDAHFFEYPLGEAFFPPPTIIYSKITVRNLDRKIGINDITSNIGRTEYQFYTSKDFPIYSDMDGLQSYLHKPDPHGDLFNNFLESSIYLSQGSILKLNNMHGKLKSILTFQEGNNNPISGVKYTYKTNIDGLDNNLSVIDESGIISNNIIGQHVETVADFRAQNSESYSHSLGIDLDLSVVGIYPIPIPSIYVGHSSETNDFYSATLNKVVTQQGVLTKVETISNFATSTSENLIWDAKTTDVILSRTTTNFRDFDYSYETPAHWVYKGMGGAFKNIGYGFKNRVTQSTGQITLANGLLFPGDEVALEFTDVDNKFVSLYTDRLWIKKDIITGNLVLVDRAGNLCNNSGTPGTTNVFVSSPINTVLKVIRSGYRNVLDETAERISYSSNPTDVSGTFINLANNVLEASASEYSEDWQKFCSTITSDNCISSQQFNPYCTTIIPTSSNPYILNTKGNWNEKRTYAYLGNRLEKDPLGAHNMDIRKDGTYDTYKPFFSYFSGTWKEVYNPTRTSDYNPSMPFANWILNSELVKVTSFGNEVEAKDAINRYSSSLFGYNQTHKTAVAANAKYRDIGYDNFEDYGYKNCSENHFNFKASYINLVNGIAHTGRFSMKVNPGQCISTTKTISLPDFETAFGSNNVIVPGPLVSLNESLTNSLEFYSSSCIPDFTPSSNMLKDQKYSLSVWVKENQANMNGDYTNISANIKLNGIQISTLVKKSLIINGWQKLDYEFTIPAYTASLSSLVFSMQNTGIILAYFDDIRVQPFNATMGTYAYDPLSLRIWAELDERNFATIYEYDNEGVLVRVKKETEKGISTIQEIRNSFKKQ